MSHCSLVCACSYTGRCGGLTRPHHSVLTQWGQPGH